MIRYHHRRIHTGERTLSGTLVIADDGRIVAVLEGDFEGERLPGAAVVPGFIDTHAHLTSLGGGLDDLDLNECANADVLLGIVCAAATGKGPDEWITGTGWVDGPHWGPCDADALDRAAAGRPVAVYRRDRHALMASKRALQLAAVGPSTPDPPGGLIRRDETGRPTGLLVDTAMEAVAEVIPALSVDQLAREVRKKARRLASRGVTCVHEAYTEPSLWQAFDALRTDGHLPVRVRVMLGAGFETPPQAEQPRWLRPIGVKGFADGALGSHGAQLVEPYCDDPGRGLAVQSDAELSELADRAVAWQLQMAVHAIGDEAFRRTLDLYEAYAGGDPAAFYRARRWRIEHAQLIRPDDLARVDGLGLAIQPVHYWDDAPWATTRLGPERLAWSHRARTLIEAGALVGLGSDYPIASGDPLAGIRAATAPVHPEAPHWSRAAERLTRAQAFEGYWRPAAALAFDEGSLGRLEAGYEADFACLSAEPFEASLDQLDVRATFVAGKSIQQP